MDWFLYDRNLTHERVKLSSTVKLRNLTDLAEKSLTFFIKKLRRPSQVLDWFPNRPPHRPEV